MGIKFCDNNWITIKGLSKQKNLPEEIVVDKQGNVFIDGDLYEENKSKYENFSVNVDKYNKMSMGEDTQKMLEEQKKYNKGETATIHSEETPTKSETTTIKY